MLNASAAQLSVQQNADMRRISAMAALIALPTILVGAYGMNFDHMQELTWRYGTAVLTVIVVVCALDPACGHAKGNLLALDFNGQQQYPPRRGGPRFGCHRDCMR